MPHALAHTHALPDMGYHWHTEMQAQNMFENITHSLSIEHNCIWQAQTLKLLMTESLAADRSLAKV